MIIDLDLDRCISCGACAVACMDQNDIEPLDGDIPFRSVCTLEEHKEEKVRYTNLSIACMHCADAPCVTGCPTASLYKDPDSGLTLYDGTNCIGCHSCAMACPFGVPAFSEENKLTKCDGCVQRVRAGFKPACVRVCPFNALTVYASQEEYLSAKRRRSLQAICRALTKY